MATNRVVWSILYERCGVEYWWDIPPEVCASLEDKTFTHVHWWYDWGRGEPPTHYLLDKGNKLCQNLTRPGARPRRMRRMVADE